MRAQFLNGPLLYSFEMNHQLSGGLPVEECQT